MLTRITVHKLEQTSWLERAARHAEIAALGQQNDEENTRLLKEAKVKFKEPVIKVNEEIETASNMITEAQDLVHAEELIVELRRVDESLVSIREEYVDYIKRVNELFALLINGNIRSAEQIANETEKLDEGFNQRLERFLCKTGDITQCSLSNIREKDEKAIIVVASIISITLVLTSIALFLDSDRKIHRP